MNVHLRDGVLPLAELLAKPAIDAMHLTFVPTREQVTVIDDELLTKHPELTLRLHRLPDGSEFGSLRGLSRLKRLVVEHEVVDASFFEGLDGLEELSCEFEHEAPTAIVWPKRLRHLSLVADTVERLERLSGLRSLRLGSTVRDFAFLVGCPELASLSIVPGFLNQHPIDWGSLRVCRKLTHLRAERLWRFDSAELSKLASLSVVYLQLHHLPLETLAGLGDRIEHIELVAMRDLRSIDWPGLSRIVSLGIVGPYGVRLKELDLSMVPRCDRLRRVSLSSALEHAPGGAAALVAFPKGPKNLYITEFRAAVKQDLQLEAPFV